MVTGNHHASSSRLLQASAFVLLLVFGQWIALAHACDIEPWFAQPTSCSPAHPHGAPDHDDSCCIATTVVHDEAADTFPKPLAPDVPAAGPPVTRLPPPVVGRTLAARPAQPRVQPPSITLYGRLRI